MSRPRSAGLVLLGILGCFFATLPAGGDPQPPDVSVLPYPKQAAPAAPCHQEPPTPVVTLKVRVPAAADPGKELEYRICVENRSPAAAHHVVVTNPLPPKTTFVRSSPVPHARDPVPTWLFGTLEPGACKEVVLVLQPGDVDEVANCARVQFEHGQCVTTRLSKKPAPAPAPKAPQPAVREGAGPVPPPGTPGPPGPGAAPVPPLGALSLRKVGPEQAVLNQTLDYRLTVSNTGTVPVNKVVVTDTLPAGLVHDSGRAVLNWDFGNLGPGQTRSVDFKLVARAAGKLCNKAAVVGEGALKQEAEYCVTVTEAKVALDFQGPARRYVSQPATYQITVRNPGPVALREVFLNVALPEGVSFVSAGEGSQQVAGEVKWPVGALEPGASRTVQLVLRGRAPGEVLLRATATATGGTTAAAEFRTEFLGTAGLTVDLTDEDDPVEVASETKYTLLVRNQGSAPVTGLQVRVVVPDAMQTVQARGPTTHQQQAQVLRYEPTVLRPGAEARYEIDVRAARDGDVRFTTELTADQLTPGVPLVQQESTRIYPILPASRKKNKPPPRGKESEPERRQGNPPKMPGSP